MIEYFAMALGFYIGAVIWQTQAREGLCVWHLFAFFFFGILWPAFCLLGGFVWLDQQDFMNIRIGGK